MSGTTPGAEGTWKVGGGRYVVGDALGAGGTARVYRAFDTVLGVERAVKILRGDKSRWRDLRPRLYAEAKVMAALHHPNILTIYDFGQDPDCDWVVMELATGSLDDVLLGDEHPPPGTIVDYALQVLAALSAAHQQRIVHRDVKPQNILLDRDGLARLADFGIARIPDESAPHLTATGDAVGSFAFMPPEQRLDARSVGPAADLYAVAATVYVLLTGRSPVDLFSAPADSSRWSDLPPHVREVLRTCTRFAPAERPSTARAMAETLFAAAVEDGLLAATDRVRYHVFDGEPPDPPAPDPDSTASLPGVRSPTLLLQAPTLTPGRVQVEGYSTLAPARPAAAAPVEARRNFRRTVLAGFAIPILLFGPTMAWLALRPWLDSHPPPAAAVVRTTPTRSAPASTPPSGTATAAGPTTTTPTTATTTTTPTTTTTTTTTPTPTTTTTTTPTGSAARSTPALGLAGHADLPGVWAANLPPGTLYLDVGADGPRELRFGVLFTAAAHKAATLRWDGDALVVEGVPFQGQRVDLRIDRFEAERLRGTVLGEPPAPITFYRDIASGL